MSLPKLMFNTGMRNWSLWEQTWSYSTQNSASDLCTYPHTTGVTTFLSTLVKQHELLCYRSRPRWMSEGTAFFSKETWSRMMITCTVKKVRRFDSLAFKETHASSMEKVWQMKEKHRVIHNSNLVLPSSKIRPIEPATIWSVAQSFLHPFLQ